MDLKFLIFIHVCRKHSDGEEERNIIHEDLYYIQLLFEFDLVFQFN